MTSGSPDNYSTPDPYIGRAAPWSSEAEQAVLGAMLLDQDAALRATELLDDTMFYREANRRLFRAMVALTERRTVIDHVTLRDELIRRGELDSAGGLEYVGELLDAVPTAANLEFHARIIRVETSATEAYGPTRGFYASMKYTEEARIRDFYKVGDDLIILTKRV